MSHSEIDMRLHFVKSNKSHKAFNLYRKRHHLPYFLRQCFFDRKFVFRNEGVKKVYNDFITKNKFSEMFIL